MGFGLFSAHSLYFSILSDSLGLSVGRIHISQKSFTTRDGEASASLFTCVSGLILLVVIAAISRLSALRA